MIRDWSALAAQCPDHFLVVEGVTLPIIAGGGGGKAPKVPPPPGPTAQEIAIQEQQAKLLAIQVQQAERNEAIYGKLDPVETAALLQEQVTLGRQQVQRAIALGPDEERMARRQLEVTERQLDMAERGMKIQDALQPFVLQQMRLVEDGEPGSGKIRRMTEDEYVATLSPVDKKMYDNTLLALDRESKALKGELPLSEGGQRRKRDEFAAFKEQMARGGNVIDGDTPETASAGTTAGAQMLKSFTERWGLVEEAERRGELSSGSQSVLARMGVASDLGARHREGLLSAVPGYSIPGYRGSGASVAGPGMANMGAGSPNFAGALQPYQAQRAGIHSANVANAQLAAQHNAHRAAGYASLADSAAGLGVAAIGAYSAPTNYGFGNLDTMSATYGGFEAAGGAGIGYAASERRLKKNITRTTRADDRRALRVVLRGPKRMGMMEATPKGRNA